LRNHYPSNVFSGAAGDVKLENVEIATNRTLVKNVVSGGLKWDKADEQEERKTGLA
jgi:hypothetical protein